MSHEQHCSEQRTGLVARCRARTNAQNPTVAARNAAAAAQALARSCRQHSKSRPSQRTEASGKFLGEPVTAQGKLTGWSQSILQLHGCLFLASVTQGCEGLKTSIAAGLGNMSYGACVTAPSSKTLGDSLRLGCHSQKQPL